MGLLRHPRLPLYLAGLLVPLWAALAIAPTYRFDWLLENLLVFAFVPVLVLTFGRFRLSNVSYLLIAVFLGLHLVGAHYTYAEVPLDWRALGFERNHFDRVVHFSFGLLLAYPIREVFMRVAQAKGFWSYYLPLDVTLAFSAVYEVVEWLTAVLVAPEAGDAFLGAQGDPFDAVKDMALAGTGALLTMCLVAAINWRYNKRFAEDWRGSFDVHGPEPLGERSLERWRRERG
jgi:putative membrane protein